jgi:hypothetical protein
MVLAANRGVSLTPTDIRRKSEPDYRDRLE